MRTTKEQREALRAQKWRLDREVILALLDDLEEAETELDNCEDALTKTEDALVDIGLAEADMVILLDRWERVARTYRERWLATRRREEGRMDAWLAEAERVSSLRVERDAALERARRAEDRLANLEAGAGDCPEYLHCHVCSQLLTNQT